MTVNVVLPIGGSSPGLTKELPTTPFDKLNLKRESLLKKFRNNDARDTIYSSSTRLSTTIIKYPNGNQMGLVVETVETQCSAN